MVLRAGGWKEKSSHKGAPRGFSAGTQNIVTTLFNPLTLKGMQKWWKGQSGCGCKAGKVGEDGLITLKGRKCQEIPAVTRLTGDPVHGILYSVQPHFYAFIEIMWDLQTQSTQEDTADAKHSIIPSTSLRETFINVTCSASRLTSSSSLILTQKTQMMVWAQRSGAVCHPELSKLRSSGLSKPRSGEMPTSWFAQLILVPKRHLGDGQGLKFLWILFNLRLKDDQWQKTIGINRNTFLSAWYWVRGVDSGRVHLRVVRCVSSTEQPVTTLRAYRSTPSWQE